MARLSLIGIIVSLCSLLATSQGWALQCFPGAEGYGADTAHAYASSGRGTAEPDVYFINTLTANQARAVRTDHTTWYEYTSGIQTALEASGDRIIVFEVSGTIDVDGQITVDDPYCFVEGATAPDPGVTLKNCMLTVTTNNVVVHHMRVRGGSGNWSGLGCDQQDATKVSPSSSLYNVVMANNSLSWSTDEVASMWNNGGTTGYNVTWFRNLITEPLNANCHSAGDHGYNMIFGKEDAGTGGVYNIALIGNVLSHGLDRGPLIKNPFQGYMLNNLSYNFDWQVTSLSNDGGHGNIYLSYINNIAIGGPDSRNKGSQRGVYYNPNLIGTGSKCYESGTSCDNGTGSDCVEDNAGDVDTGTPPVTAPSPITVRTAAAAKTWIESYCGARPADRDQVDTLMIQHIDDTDLGTEGAIINCVEIDGGDADCDEAAEVSAIGWEALAENTRSLTLPSNPHSVAASGYTNLEEWLHGSITFVEEGEPDWPPSAIPVKPISPPFLRGITRLFDGSRSYRLY